MAFDHAFVPTDHIYYSHTTHHSPRDGILHSLGVVVFNLRS